MELWIVTGSSFKLHVDGDRRRISVRANRETF
jgi:hypothetical protein